MADIVTTSGLQAIAGRWGAVSGALTCTHLEVGTGALTPALGTAALTTALSPRVALVNSASGGVATMEGFFTNSQVNGTLTEWGIFSALAAGTLLSCGTFSPSIAKTSARVLTVTVTATFANV